MENSPPPSATPAKKPGANRVKGFAPDICCNVEYDQYIYLFEHMLSVQ